LAQGQPHHSRSSYFSLASREFWLEDVRSHSKQAPPIVEMMSQPCTSFQCLRHINLDSGPLHTFSNQIDILTLTNPAKKFVVISSVPFGS
jgi:hypothetical protein